METKHCYKCNTTKLKTEFNKNLSRKDKCSIWCKKCNKDYQETNKEKYNLYNKQYRIDNIEYFKTHRRKLSSRYNSFLSTAKKRNFLVSISFEEYCVLVGNNECIYCEDFLPEAGSGLDRKDNTQGYTLLNSVPCCSRCNTMKGSNLTYDEMMLIWAIRKGKIQKPML